MKTAIRPAMLWLLLTCMLFTSAAHAQWEQVGSPIIASLQGTSRSIALGRSGTPYVATQSDTEGHNEIIVWMYNGSAWVPLGHTGIINTNEPYALTVDLAGTPYIAADTYSILTGNIDLIVKRYDGVDWIPVGNGQIFPGKITPSNGLWLATDAAGAPYIAFCESSFAVRVMKYDGAAWISVGSPTANGNVNSLSFDSRGSLLLAFDDFTNGEKSVVMKYDNAIWQVEDTAGLGSVPHEFTWFFMSHSGTRYAILQRIYKGFPVTVMKYNGSSWAPMANSTFPFRTGISGLVFDAADVPYIFISDYTAHTSALLRYNGTAWVSTDTTRHPVGLGYSEIVGDIGGHFYIVHFNSNDGIRMMKYTAGAANTSVAGIMHAGNITISPVPASHTLTIRNAAAALNGSTASITDIQGREMYRFVITSSYSIDVSGWPVGIYCLHMADGKVMKMVKG